MLSILFLQSEFFGLIVLILLILVIVIPIAIWKSRKKTNKQTSEYDPNRKFALDISDVPTKQEVDTIKEEINPVNRNLYTLLRVTVKYLVINLFLLQIQIMIVIVEQISREKSFLKIIYRIP